MSALVMYMIRPYIVTVFLELMAAVFWGVRKKKDFLVVFLVNTITNPALNVILLLLGYYFPYAAYKTAIPVMELMICLLEGILFKYNMQKMKRPFLFSFCLNAVSFFLGGVLLKCF